MKKLLALLISVCFSTVASGDVVLDFTNDLDGFVQNAGAGNGTVSHSTAFGGTMEIVASGGYAGDAAQLGLGSAALAELNAALVNGGTFSYDVIVQADDVIANGNPNWFESYAVLNSGGGWDSNARPTGFSFPLTPGTTYTQNVMMGILGSPLANDANLNSPGGATTPLTWAQLYLGTNNDGGSIAIPDSVTMYFDNVTISANPAVVPEPSSMLAIGAFGIALLSRRRRC